MKKNYNSLLLFCSSLIPGAGYMYLGLMQRGVEAMILFMAGIVIPVWLQMEALCALIIVPLWFYCFFDTFYQRTNLEAGLEVEDRGMVNLISWVADNYYLLGIGLIGLGILALLNTLGQDLSYSANVIIKQVTRHLQGYLPPLLLIAVGIYLLRKTRQQDAKTDDRLAVLKTASEVTSIKEVDVTGERNTNAPLEQVTVEQQVEDNKQTSEL